MLIRFRWLLGAVALVLAPCAHAHLLNITRVMLTYAGQRHLQVQVDIDLSLLLGDYRTYGELLELAPAEQASRLEALGPRVLQEIGLRLDGRPFDAPAQQWQLPAVPPERVGDQAVAAMTTFRYDVSVPAGVREVRLAPGPLARIEFPLAYTNAIPAQDLLMTRWIELPGAMSRPLRLPDEASAAPALAASASGSGRPEADPAGGPATPAPAETGPRSGPDPAAEDFTAGELRIARFVSTVLQHLRLGFRHIFPDGLDHVLFVLGLFFLGARWRPLVWQTTAFTIAHTTTLGLSAYGIFSLPARLVEPLIALSIAYVALENLWRHRIGPARVAVVFGFGLLHGLGFASSLSEVPMPRDQFFTALLSFNLGVDFGQIAVLAVAFLTVGWFREKSWYRAAIVFPACGIIAAIGLYWTITRAFF